MIGGTLYPEDFDSVNLNPIRIYESPAPNPKAGKYELLEFFGEKYRFSHRANYNRSIQGV
jgi:hypothetical protein